MQRRVTIAHKSLGTSDLTKVELANGRMKEYAHVVAACVHHLRNMPPGTAITTLSFDDNKCVEEWVTHATHWNVQIGSQGYSPADMCMLARIHARVASEPRILLKKSSANVSPLIVVTELQRICQQWCWKDTDATLLETTRKHCYAILVMYNKREITQCMITSSSAAAVGEGKEEKKMDLSEKERFEADEKQFRVASLSAGFLSFCCRTWMHVDLSRELILKRFPVDEIKIDMTDKRKFTAWLDEEMSCKPSETMIQSFKQVFYQMVMPLGAELWYQRNKMSEDTKSPEAMYTTEVGIAADDELRKSVSDKELEDVYKDSRTNFQVRNALVFALYNYMFSTYLNRPWREQYCVLECELRRKYTTVIDPLTFGKPRLPMIIQIGPSFYVHHNGKCNTIAGDALSSRDIENAIILWAHLVVTQFDSKLAFGEDASAWFKLFL
jgi:hypothetical protein